MSLSTILKEIEVNQVNAQMNTDMGAANTLGSRVGLKRAATEALRRLKLDYRQHLMETTAFIVVTGSARDQFTETASGDAFGCFSADPEAFYKDLVSKIDPTLFGRENARNMFNIASNILYDKCMDLDLGSYMDIQFSEKYNSSVSKPEELVQLIKQAVNDRTGSEVAGINAVHSLVDKAIEKKHSASVTPVILSTSDDKFALDLAKNLKKHTLSDGTERGVTNNVFLVVAGKAPKELQATKGAVLIKMVTEDSVAAALETIRNNVQ